MTVDDDDAQPDSDQASLAWQTSVWDRISPTYLREIDKRFAPVIDEVVARAELRPGQHVLDLGTGTGAAAVRAAPAVALEGSVAGHDISSDMLTIARQRAAQLGLENVSFSEGRAEDIPASEGSFDTVLASLMIMYVIDRAAAAREIARVLRSGGRFVAAVWAGPEECDIVRFQQTAGRFAPPPPVPGVGPGALADPSPFLQQLTDAAIDAKVRRKTLGFDFQSFDLAWDVLAGVTAAQLDTDKRAEAKAAVQAEMWSRGDGPRRFRNVTQFIVGQRL
jgi:SAM-dependent methyltransferase